MRLAAVQHDIVWEDPEANFGRLRPLIAAAAGAGARLVVLTEMFSTGFSMNTAVTAEPQGGPSETFLLEQAGQHDVWVAGSVPQSVTTDDRPVNQHLLVTPRGDVYRYAKIHPFTYSGEHEHFAAGGGHVTVDVEGVRCSLFVCYDLRFADEFWALAQDTDCYLVPANWPATRREHWTTLLRARAVENQAYVVGVNRVGEGGGLEYVGDSRIIDPLGRILAGAAHDETVLLAEVDPDRVDTVRRDLPFLQDRR